MNNPTHTPADIAIAAWKAAGLKPETLRRYRIRWESWQTWCDANGIDPLGASHDDYTAFQADHTYKTRIRAEHASALFHPYRHVGKPSPAHRPPSQNRASKQSSDPILKRFESWCKANGTTSLPAPAPGRGLIPHGTGQNAPQELSKASFKGHRRPAHHGRVRTAITRTRSHISPETPQGNTQATGYRHRRLRTA